MDINSLLDAGSTLASLSDPQRDLDTFPSDIREVADTLKSVAGCLEHACENAEDIYSRRRDLAGARQLWNIREAREMTTAEIEACRSDDLLQARDKACREAQRALIELARLVRELSA
jgi:hypothetical protein